MIWEKKEISSDQVRTMAELYGIDFLTASILLRRGVTEAGEISFYLENDLKLLHNPFRFEQMEDAVDRIQMAVEEEEKVLIFGDRDVDGVTSTVLVYETLTAMGLSPQWRVPGGDDTYGLSIPAIEEFAADNGTLIITVDCGISNNREVARCNELGIDVIILDHHIKEDGAAPDAAAIVNPKLENTTYPFYGLSGCGVVSKWIWALCFSKTEWYNRSYTLLHARKDGDIIKIELSRQFNLMETDRTEILSDKIDAKDQLIRFLGGSPIFVFGLEEQKALLREFFGPYTQIFLLDIREELLKEYPGLKGMDWQTIKDKSRLARYKVSGAADIDIVSTLFNTLYLKKNESLFQPFSAALDLVAIGTIADMMPLIDENRILIKQGLQQLKKTPRPALQDLMTKLKIAGGPMGTQEVSWQISPFLNSPGRMGEARLAVEFLLATDQDRRRELMEQIDALNKKRKKLSDSIMDQVMPMAKRSLEEMGENGVFVRHKKILRGISGIIATKLHKYFSLPAVVLSLQEDIITGSIRCQKDLDIQALFADLDGILLDHGGHACAAGFSLEAARLPELEQTLMQHFKALKKVDRTEVLTIDAEIPQNYLSPDLKNIIDRLAPYGNAFPPLTFISRNISIEDPEIMGRNGSDHLKFLVTGKSCRWPAVYWNGLEKYNSGEFSETVAVDIVYKIRKNWYHNNETLQLSVVAIEKSENK